MSKNSISVNNTLGNLLDRSLENTISTLIAGASSASIFMRQLGDFRQTIRLKIVNSRLRNNSTTGAETVRRELFFFSLSLKGGGDEVVFYYCSRMFAADMYLLVQLEGEHVSFC
jgi:hypothetical protein